MYALDAGAVAQAMIGQLLGLFVETQFCPADERDAMAAERARQLAALGLRPGRLTISPQQCV